MQLQLIVTRTNLEGQVHCVPRDWLLKYTKNWANVHVTRESL